MITRIRSNRGTFKESWTEDKIQFVRENFQKMSYSELAKRVGSGATEDSIYYVVRKKLKLRKLEKRKCTELWSRREDDILREKYAMATRSEIIKALRGLGGGRTWEAIKCRARRLGLKRDKKFLSPKNFPEESRRRVFNARSGKSSHRRGKSLEEEYGVERSKEIRKKLRSSHIGHVPNKEVREKLSRVHKGRQILWSHKVSDTVKKLWDNPEYREKQSKARAMKPNKFERSFSKCFPELKYVGNFGFWVGRYNPDFILPNTNKCVDLFCKLWHTYQEEKERIGYFASHGYALLVVWYKNWMQSKRSKKALIEKVRDFIRGE